tara:strand:- start:630 stop:2057 length:1428 start_codon:yes stop_codon:yes gene_type:complete
MNFVIIQENGRDHSNRHMRECHSLAHWLKELGCTSVCWGLGHENFDTPLKDLVDKNSFVFCLENYNTGWLPDLSNLPGYKIFWSIDSHCALNEHLETAKINKFNLHLNSQKIYMKYFEQHSDECMWFPNAADHRFFKPSKEQKTINLSFIGSMIADRPQIIPYLKQTLGLQSFSNVLGDDYVEKINQTRVMFNKSISNDINYRIFESTACAVPIVTNYVPGLEELYDLDSEIVVYTTFKELVGAIVMTLSDKNLQKDISAAGYKRFIENHTYMHRCITLIEKLIEKTHVRKVIEQENKALYDRYSKEYNKLKDQHQVYKQGWSSSFYSGHRSANWALLEIIKKEKYTTLLDIGAYDAMFAKIASKYKTVFMVEKHPWPEMWDLVGVDKTKINVQKPQCEIVTLMNVAHNWPLSEIIEKVKSINGSLPKVIYLDSCFSNNHKNNPDYCNESKMKTHGFDLVYKKGRMLWNWRANTK